MKKYLALLLALAMMLSLVACGEKDPDPVVDDGNQTVYDQQQPDPVVEEVWSSVDADGNLKLTERDDVGQNGMVTTANVYATMAGLEVLEMGGNAVDAAIAISYALGVVEPNASGLGGGGFFNIHMVDGSEVVIDYREVAPAAQDAHTWLNEDGTVKNGNANSVGALACGVPGTVASLEYALENYGSGKLTRQQIMQPAIDLATEGYVVGATTAGAIADYYDYMVTDYTALGDYYLRADGLPYEVGEVITNPDLAKSLQLIADGGKDVFYTSEIAEAIIEALNSYGGVMTLEDLAGYEPAICEPVKGTYRGYEIVSCPPASSGGTHIVEVLNILENFDVGALEINSPEYIHLFTEAYKLGYTDRAAYMADTAFADVPLGGITSKEFAAERAALIDLTVDQDFGSGVMVKGCGFMMNNEMGDFDTNPESVNKVEPGKKPLSSMSPTIVLKEGGSPYLVLGTPGGSRIFASVLQIISRVIDHGMSIHDALCVPKIWNTSTTDNISYENPLKGYEKYAVSEETVAALTAMGHEKIGTAASGAVQAIEFLDDGTLYGTADPRQDGKAVGVDY